MATFVDTPVEDVADDSAHVGLEYVACSVVVEYFLQEREWVDPGNRAHFFGRGLNVSFVTKPFIVDKPVELVNAHGSEAQG